VIERCALHLLYNPDKSAARRQTQRNLSRVKATRARLMELMMMSKGTRALHLRSFVCLHQHLTLINSLIASN